MGFHLQIIIIVNAKYSFHDRDVLAGATQRTLFTPLLGFRSGTRRKRCFGDYGFPAVLDFTPVEAIPREEMFRRQDIEFRCAPGVHCRTCEN